MKVLMPFAVLHPVARGLNSELAQAALDLFEAEWIDLIGRPSSISADQDAQVSFQSMACNFIFSLENDSEVFALPKSNCGKAPRDDSCRNTTSEVKLPFGCLRR